MSGNPNARSGVPLILLASALAFASGAADLTSFTRLGGVFASVMTGNLILLGLAITRASATLAAHTAVAFGGYIAGAALGSRIGTGSGNEDEDELWPPAVTVTLLAELLAFAGFTVGWELSGSHPAGAAQLCLLAVAALAMGLQSAAMRGVGTPLSTTYLTGTLTGAVAEIVTAGRRGKGIGRSAAVLAAAAAGAAAGGGVLIVAPAALPVLPAGAIAIVIVLATTSGRDKRDKVTG